MAVMAGLAGLGGAARMVTLPLWTAASPPERATHGPLLLMHLVHRVVPQGDGWRSKCGLPFLDHEVHPFIKVVSCLFCLSNSTRYTQSGR